MDYCTVGPDSDDHVVATDGLYCCLTCTRAPASTFKTYREIYNHLVEHVFANDKVPAMVLKQLLRAHHEEIDAKRPKWTPDEAEEILEKLRLYYGEPVMRVGQYCEAFRTWRTAIEAASEKAQDGSDEKASLERMASVINEVECLVVKSNLLWRLIYGGEELRTEPCPIHNGRWSGCVWGEGRCPHCMSGDNVTGWIAPTSS